MPWNGSDDQRRALRSALMELRDKELLTQLARDVSKYGANTSNFMGITLDRTTLSRWCDEEKIFNGRDQKCHLLYSFLENTSLLRYKNQYISEKNNAHFTGLKSFPVEKLFLQLGVTEFRPDAKSLLSLKGTFHIYRKSWLPYAGSQLFIRARLRFYENEGVIMGEHTQKFQHPKSERNVDEIDIGPVLGLGDNVFFFGFRKGSPALKFFVFDRIAPRPSERESVSRIEGTVIGAVGQGPHHGHRFIAFRENSTNRNKEMGIIDESELDEDTKQAL